MGRYRKIEVCIWSDAKFASLSDRGKLVFLFVLTHPHMTSLGAMRATVPGLASELQWQEKAFREAFQEALVKGLLEVAEQGLISVPKFLKHNPPESPNVVKSWKKITDVLPECSLKSVVMQRVKGFMEGLGEGFRKAFENIEEGFRKGMPYQEPEPEPEPEPEQEVTTVPVTSLFVSEWNKANPSQPILRVTASRRGKITTRLSDPEWNWQAALAKFPLRCFTDPGGWRPDLDWFLKPDTVTKILEGKYDWEKNTNGPKQPTAGQLFDKAAGTGNDGVGDW